MFALLVYAQLGGGLEAELAKKLDIRTFLASSSATATAAAAAAVAGAGGGGGIETGNGKALSPARDRALAAVPGAPVSAARGGDNGWPGGPGGRLSGGSLSPARGAMAAVRSGSGARGGTSLGANPGASQGLEMNQSQTTHTSITTSATMAADRGGSAGGDACAPSQQRQILGHIAAAEQLSCQMLDGRSTPERVVSALGATSNLGGGVLPVGVGSAAAAAAIARLGEKLKQAGGGKGGVRGGVRMSPGRGR